MAADADDAITEAEGGAVRYCYVTPKIVITEDQAEVADENAQLVFKVCQNMGFDPRIETINAVEAWLGSFQATAGTTCDAAGQHSKPCRHHPAHQHLARPRDQSMPVLSEGHAGTSAMARPPAARRSGSICTSATPATPASMGPTGSGKSVALGTIVGQLPCGPRLQIFFFDKGYSAFVLTKALGGQHLDLGEDEVPLQPLARIDDDTDRMKLQGLLEDWIELQAFNCCRRSARRCGVR